MSDWNKYELSEVADIVGGGTPNTSTPEFWNGDIPWITPKDLADHSDVYIARGERSITAKGLQASGARLLPKGSVLFSSRAPIGYIAIASTPVTTNQGFKSLVPKNIVSNQFLYYLIKENTEEIKAHASGTTFMEISGSVLKKLSFRFPPLLEQQAIARILGSLDDKIELNRQMNHTLETMAQTLFKSWFVDFDPVVARSEGRRPYGMTDEVASLFPSKLVESELGMIPDGWGVDKIASICSTQYGYTASSTDINTGVKLLRVTDINKLPWIEWSTVPFCAINETGYQKYKLSAGDILVSRMADPGKAAIVETEISAVFASYLIRISTIDDYRYYLYYFLRSKAYLEYAEGVSSGTVQKNMNAGVITAAPMVIPSPIIGQTFSKQVSVLRNQINDNLHANNLMTSIRNSLLSKLISGEIRIKDVERFMVKA